MIRSNARVVARFVMDNRMSISVYESSLPLVIGRGSDCDISIPDSHISRHHCELSEVNGVLCLKDTSANGTQVAGRLLTGESVTIAEETAINLGGAAKIKIAPVTESTVNEDDRGDERRAEDCRRAVERRVADKVVAFERRTTQRRADSRRQMMSRRSAQA